MSPRPAETLVLAAGLALLSGCSLGRSLPEIAAVPGFSLTERSGAKVAREDLAGRVWIADFIFTTCAGTCPMMTSEMSDIQKSLGDIADIRLVSFTVDPDHDTPEVLVKYANEAGAEPGRWLFLTGGAREIQDLAQNGFKLTALPGQPGGEDFIHSQNFTLVDRAGIIRGYYDGADQDAVVRLRDDARWLAASKG